MKIRSGFVSNSSSSSYLVAGFSIKSQDKLMEFLKAIPGFEEHVEKRIDELKKKYGGRGYDFESIAMDETGKFGFEVYSNEYSDEVIVGVSICDIVDMLAKYPQEFVSQILESVNEARKLFPNQEIKIHSICSGN